MLAAVQDTGRGVRDKWRSCLDVIRESEECDGRVYKAIHEEVFLEVATVYGSTLGALRTEASTWWESMQQKLHEI